MDALSVATAPTLHRPARMIAVCVDGHEWPVEVTWVPTSMQHDGVPCTIQVPHPMPAFCFECFCEHRAVMPPARLRWRAEDLAPEGRS